VSDPVFAVKATFATRREHQVAECWQRLYDLVQLLEPGSLDGGRQRLLEELETLRRELCPPPLKPRDCQGDSERRAVANVEQTALNGPCPGLHPDGIGQIAASLLHELAQPLNTAGCYAVAARNLASKSGSDSARLCDALRGIDQQIQLAGSSLDRLRALFRGVTSDRPGISRASPGGSDVL